ncbi:MAG: ErfK/YbiS/YcfS/YnhG family protein [Myxococcales bacterium]|nr:ErfK/YbiS/YcfS/YnhG family protein [Myxococcales bacterium]
MLRACALAAALLTGCHGKEEPAPQPVPEPQAEQPEAPVTQPDFPEGTRSLQLTRTVGVRLEPAEDAKRIGNIAIDTRVAWNKIAAGKGCDKPWVEIEPRGWVCGEYLIPSKKAPYGQEVPHLDRGEIVPGIYGKVTGPGATTYALEKKKKDKKKKGPVTSPDDDQPKMIEDKPLVGSVNVRQYDEITIGGRVYWKISQKDNEYVQQGVIARHVPSRYGGSRLADDTGIAMPIAFVWPRYGGLQAWTMAKPTGGVMRQLDARVALPIVETSNDKDGKPIAYRIGEGEWIAAADVRAFKPAAPPPYLEKNERWIDVDLDQQILVAYEGDLAVYATMVSSGGKETPTETGVYRMWLKESEADMKGLNGEDPYSVATVPWTQFFSPEKGLALHTAYWHDQFGHQRSHGCVNLAPRDARWLYFWSDPQVPPGWTMTAGVVEAPGSVVRIRTTAEPEPPAKGYAKKVLEARQQNAPAR